MPLTSIRDVSPVTVTVTETIVTIGTVDVTIVPSTTLDACITSHIAIPTTGTLSLDCPGLTATQTIDLGGPEWTFTPQCGVDLNGDGVDILAIVSYSFEDCLMACASYNRNSGTTDCVGVEFSADMANIASNFGTCWLKKYTSVQTVDTNSTNFDLHVAAILVT